MNHFSSREFTAFLNRFPPSKNTLLLPTITSNEIYKHIRMRVDEVVNTINKLQKRLPRIKTLQGWPLSENSKEQLIEGLIKIEEDAFNSYKPPPLVVVVDSFINKFNLIEIDLNDVSLEELFDWYFKKLPPFGKGKKSKEFPDAAVISSIANFARQKHIEIAVVSTDLDIYQACVLDVNYFVRFATTILSGFSLSPFLSCHLLF